MGACETWGSGPGWEKGAGLAWVDLGRDMRGNLEREGELQYWGGGKSGIRGVQGGKDLGWE